jgi:hypothetical protein
MTSRPSPRPSSCCRSPSEPMPRPSPTSQPATRSPPASRSALASTIMTCRRGSRSWIFPGTMVRPIPSASSTAANHTFISSASWRRRRSGWPPTTWRAGRRCGTSRSRRTRVLHRGAGSRSCSTCATAPLSAPCPSSSWLIAVARAPSRTMRTASRRSSHVQDPSKRRNRSSSSRGVFFRRSVSTSRPTTHSPSWLP